jgi:hypothetical protein
MHLTQQEQQQINGLVAEVEAATGAQVLAAVIGKADSYPEIPWKAFASGAAIAAFSVVLTDWLRPGWTSAHSAVFDAIAILGSGAMLSLLTIFSAPLARLFLDRDQFLPPRFHNGSRPCHPNGQWRASQPIELGNLLHDHVEGHRFERSGLAFEWCAIAGKGAGDSVEPIYLG